MHDLRIRPSNDFTSLRPFRRMAVPRKAQHIGQGVRRLRVEAGMTQSQLATAANIADGTLSRIERNRITPSVELAQRIAAALRVKMDALFATQARERGRTMRHAEMRLLAIVRDLEDAEVDDVARALKLLLGIARGRRHTGGR